MTFYSVLSPESESEGYGIRILSERHVRDISFNRKAVTKLCRQCNELKVDAVHFDYVLEDFLSSGEEV